MNICSPCSGDFAFAKCLCLGCLEDVALGNTRMLVYMAPWSYSSLGNTRMLNKFTKVSRTVQLFIHTTKITNFWLQQHNHFLECVCSLMHDLNCCLMQCYCVDLHCMLTLLTLQGDTLLLNCTYRTRNIRTGVTLVSQAIRNMFCVKYCMTSFRTIPRFKLRPCGRRKYFFTWPGCEAKL